MKLKGIYKCAFVEKKFENKFSKSVTKESHSKIGFSYPAIFSIFFECYVGNCSAEAKAFQFECMVLFFKVFLSICSSIPSKNCNYNKI